MANLTSVINVNVPTDVKEEATKIFNNLGLNMSTAINMFLKRAIFEHGIPFEVKEINPEPSKELLEALKEGDQIIKDIESGKRKPYNSPAELFANLEKELK